MNTLSRFSFVLFTIWFTGMAHAADFLSAEQIVSQLIGNTYTGIHNGTVWTETWEPHKKGKPKGKIKGIWGEQKENYSGSWKAKKDGKMCFTYPGDPSANGCWYMNMSGDQLQFHKKGQADPDFTATIVE